MPILQDETGRTFDLPDVSPDKQAQILQEILRSRRLGFPGGPAQQEFGQVLQETRRERTAGSAEQQLGAPLARTEIGQLEEFDLPGGRFDLGRSNLISEKTAKLKDKFPDLEVQTFDDPRLGQQIALRAPGSEEFALLDSTELITLGDLAGIAGLITTPETVIAIATAIATRGRSLLTRTGAQMGAAPLGRALDIGIEEARGFQDDPLEDIFADLALTAAAGGVGELAAAPFRRVGRAALGQGAIELSPSEQAAVKTMREADIRGPSLGQVQPAFQRAEQQAAATSKRVQEFRAGQMEDALKDLKRIRDDIGDVSALTDDELIGLSNRMKDNVLKMINAPNVSPERVGRALDQGRKEFKRVWGQFVGRRYDKALADGADASFDFDPAQIVARDLRRGVRAKGLPKETELIGPNGTPLIDANGLPIKVTKETQVQLRQLNSELRSVVDDVLKMEPDVRAFEGNTAFEQIKTLRTRLFDLKNATVDGQSTIQNRMAGQLWDSVSQIMDNPIGGSDRFRVLMRSAAEANRRFERILEVEGMVKIARTTELGGLIRALAQPGKSVSLRVMQRVLPKKDFATFKAGVLGDFMSEPENILRRLDAFRRDPQALRILLSEGEEAQLRILGTRAERLGQGALQRALKEQTSLPIKIKTLVNSGGDAELAQIIKTAGGKTSRLGKAMRAGLVTSIMDAGEVTVKGRTVLNPKMALTRIEKLEKNGVLAAVMQPSEVKALKDRKLMLSILPVSSDAGASIRAAETVSEVADILTVPVKGMSALRRFFSGITGLARNAVVGKIFISERARKLFVGAGASQMDFTTLRAAAVISAEVAAGIERDQLGKKQP